MISKRLFLGLKMLWLRISSLLFYQFMGALIVIWMNRN